MGLAKTKSLIRTLMAVRNQDVQTIEEVLLMGADDLAMISN